MMKLILFLMSIIALMLIFNKNKIYKINTHTFMVLSTMILLSMFNNTYMSWSKIYYFSGLDNLSISLIMLTIWINSLATMAFTPLKKTSNMFLITILMMTLALVLCFSSINMLTFYIMFESSLIPMIFIIMGWGAQIDRIQASMYMLFYTLLGSLPFLVTLFFLFKKLNTLSFILMYNFSNTLYSNNIFLFLSILGAFLIKLPLYFTHSWLPKAHTEAPVSGSMILAGIMLKLGTYSIYRLILIFNFINMKFSFIIISVSLVGSIYCSLMCLNQMDMKIIVAYSSIVHMNFSLASLFMANSWGFKGTLWMMIAHGLCSSALFFLVNLNYERTHSRLIIFNKGLINILPSLSMWWFLICVSNFGAPPSMNLLSEIILIKSILSKSNLNLVMVFFIPLLSTLYSILLFSSQHGKFFNTMNFKMISVKEFLIILLHWTPLNLIFMNLLLF
uniref:NADH-ubiquinone oxidoreductase chain 4 n=1 Tax=Elasmosoma sp. QL-2014 TaxID=1491720 RepID=A0A0U1X149_9HYME|nr:NADH dehydrogenase subunit 4 [Elasmosoma sp. QL-2014]